MFRPQSTNQSKTTGFTLIELLVVIVIIAILATMATILLSNARTKARDAKRLADMKQLNTALEMYYNDQGYYPTAITANTALKSPDNLTTYLNLVPANPTPTNDGSCPASTGYSYQTQTNNTSYAITFCLGNASSGITSGTNSSTPAGILAGGTVAACTQASDCNTNNTNGDVCTSGQCVYDSYTKLLLHMNGANGSTTFTDSATSKSVAPAGSAQISTVQSKFSGTSSYFNGTNAYLTVPNSDDFNPTTGDFTIDMWAYHGNLSDGATIFNLYQDASNYVYLYWSPGYGYVVNITNAGSSSIVTTLTPKAYSQWDHIALVKTGTTSQFYINGSLDKAPTTVTWPNFSSSTIIYIGRWGGGGAFYTGYIDELRVSKYARWTCGSCVAGTNYFTPPAREY